MSDDDSPLVRRRHIDNESTENETSDYTEEVELTGCGASSFCNPYKRLHRYIVLIPICFLSFGKL